MSSHGGHGLNTGSRNGHAKANDVMVAEMRRRFRKGSTVPELALAFGLSRSATWSIVNYETWREKDTKPPAKKPLRVETKDGLNWGNLGGGARILGAPGWPAFCKECGDVRYHDRRGCASRERHK